MNFLRIKFNDGNKLYINIAGISDFYEERHRTEQNELRINFFDPKKASLEYIEDREYDPKDIDSWELI